MHFNREIIFKIRKKNNQIYQTFEQTPSKTETNNVSFRLVINKLLLKST